MATELRIARGFALPLDMVTEATGIVATRGAGKSSASAVIVEESHRLGVQVVVFDRTGVYFGLRSNANGDGPGLPIYVLGGAHGDVPLETHAGSLIADLVVDHPEHSFVLDFSDFSKSATVKFTADFLERLYDRKARSRTTTLLVLDEAHFYAPQTPRGGFKGDSARLMGAMEDVVGLGRSRGLGVILTTQRTQALNKSVLDLIETLLVMRMLSPRARDAVQDWIREKHEDDREGVIATLDSLPTGTAWVWSPLRGILKKVALRRIKTFDSYATPKPGEVRIEPSARKELDLSGLGEKMRETAERARASDPKELRREIVDLRDRLAAFEAAPPRAEVEIQEVEKIIEVPVFTDEDRKWLHHIAKALEGIPEQMHPIHAKLAELTEAAKEKVAAAPRPSPPSPPRPRPIPTPTKSSPMSRARESAAENGGVPAPQQKILDALGWYEALSVPTPTRVQVALIAGYSATSGGYANLLGKLSTAGHVTYPSPGAVTLTDSGRALATDPGLPSTNEGVQAEVLARLPAPQAKLLRALLDCWPDSMSREELAMRTGYSPTSGGFANLLGRLRTGALIEYPDRGHVVASDVLFPVR